MYLYAKTSELLNIQGSIEPIFIVSLVFFLLYVFSKIDGKISLDKLAKIIFIGIFLFCTVFMTKQLSANVSVMTRKVEKQISSLFSKVPSDMKKMIPKL